LILNTSITISRAGRVRGIVCFNCNGGKEQCQGNPVLLAARLHI